MAGKVGVLKGLKGNERWVWERFVVGGSEKALVGVNRSESSHV